MPPVREKVTDMSTHRHDRPKARLSDGELYARMVAFGLDRARQLRAVAVRRTGQALLRHLAATLQRCGDASWTWQNRYNAHRHMETLDARLLDDVGLTREDVAGVAGKSLWRV